MPAPSAAEAADFAASIAEAVAASSEDDNADPAGVAPPEVDADDDAAADDELEPEADDTIARECGALIAAGKVKEACAKMGISPKVLGFNVPRFERMRQGLAKSAENKAAADKALADAKALEDNAKAIKDDARARYGQLVDLRLAVKAGDFYAVRDIIEGLAPPGTTAKQILEAIDKVVKGESPSEALYRSKLREMAAKGERDAEAAEAAKKAEADKASEAERGAKNLANATAQLKRTDFEGVDGAPEALLRIARENWDSARKGLKVEPKQLVKLLAKDPVIAKLVRLKKFEAAEAGDDDLDDGEPAPVVRRAPAGRGRLPVTNPRATDRESKAAREAAAFKASIAAAARQEAIDLRRGRR